MRAAERIIDAFGLLKRNRVGIAAIIDAETGTAELVAVMQEAEEHSRKRLAVKKSTWLKMRAVLNKVKGETQ